MQSRINSKIALKPIKRQANAHGFFFFDTLVSSVITRCQRVLEESPATIEKPNGNQPDTHDSIGTRNKWENNTTYVPRKKNEQLFGVTGIEWYGYHCFHTPEITLTNRFDLMGDCLLFYLPFFVS